MTQEDIKFISDNQAHFNLVINCGQNFQRSHDIASKVIQMAERLMEKPVDRCTGCEREAYEFIWNEYGKATQKDRAKAKG